MLKTNAVAWRSDYGLIRAQLERNVDVVRTSWQHNERFINAPGAPLARVEIVVQTPWKAMAFAGRWHGVHRDLTAFTPR